MDWIVLRVEMWLTILGDEWNVDDKVVGWKVCGWLLMDCVSSYCVVCVSIHQDAACVWRGVPAGADWHRRSRWTVDCLAVSQHEPGRICPRLLRHFREEVLTTLSREQIAYTLWLSESCLELFLLVITQCSKNWKWAHDRIGRYLGYLHAEVDRIIVSCDPEFYGERWVGLCSEPFCLQIKQKCWSVLLLCYQWVIWVISI